MHAQPTARKTCEVNGVLGGYARRRCDILLCGFSPRGDVHVLLTTQNAEAPLPCQLPINFSRPDHRRARFR
jgi:hypothetical protein